LVVSLQKNSDNDRYWQMRQIGLLTTIPVLLAVSPIIGLLIGRFLDSKLGTEPLLMIIFLVCGFIAGARQTARVIKLASKEKERDTNRGP